MIACTQGVKRSRVNWYGRRTGHGENRLQYVVQVGKIIGSREEFGHQEGPLDTGVTQSVRASEGSLWPQC